MGLAWGVTLTHGRVGVRPLRRRDGTTWRHLRRTDASWLTPWEATLPPGSEQPALSYASMIGGMRRRARRGQGMPFAITYDGQMVGQVSVNGITWGSARWASIGYWVASSHAGRGITPLAVALVIDHLFDTVGLHRVEISARPENEASLRVIAKLGLTEVGVAPRYLHIAGDWRDHRMFQLLAEDVPDGLVARITRS
ncbi:GNAT family acetyltransferase [Aeromicrobium sp. Root495]|uniref:GNAT family N-acetyltransferase n=1 Tax=Aeromicrobium sp. Root495 TaxID=1736550 RepID=UPI0006F4D6E3|nr:GNAT family protein [Aeromicrobium sp. Root495]KQY60284.1 GNAT family acetyltransferase [Aeromicrobium sp. Root495]RYJ00403.1 MAG: N-acetyltransferase [Actinomycetales bacterium]